MSTEKEPDYAGIAERETKRILPDTLPPWSAQKKGYASCMEARLRSDWETIRLLKLVDESCHPGNCEGEMWTKDRPGRNGKLPVRMPCTCGLRAHLSKLLEPFTP